MKSPTFKILLAVLLLVGFQNCAPFEALKISDLSGGSLASASDNFAAKLGQTKSATLYDIKDVLRDSGRIERDIKNIKDMGLNTVWIVVTWHSLEPSVGTNPKLEIGDPGYNGTLNQQNINQIKTILTLFKKNDLNVIWSLDYLGEGWAPKGIHPHRLTHGDDKLYFLRYAKFVSKIIKETEMEENVFLLFHDEGILAPYDSLHTDLEIQQSFRNFLFSRNPSLQFWNTKWKSAYSDWSEVKTFSFNSAGYSDPRLQDTVRFINTMIKENISKYLRNEIQTILPRGKVGFHYTNFSFVNHLQEDWNNDQDLPFTSNVDYDFVSLAYYDVAEPWPFRPASAADYLSAVKKHTSTELFFFGELGSAVCDTGCKVQGAKTITNPALLSRQANFLKRSLEDLLSKGVGFNIWNLQDFDFAQSRNGTLQVSTEGLFGLYDSSGAIKESGSVVRKLLKDSNQQTTYSWSVQVASECSAGQRSRRVDCLSSAGQLVADTYCGSAKPATQEVCQNTCDGQPFTMQGCSPTPPPTQTSSLPVAIIQNFGLGCDSNNCIWIIGENLRSGCRADIYKEDWSGLHSSVPAICKNSSGTFEIPADLVKMKKSFHFTIVNTDDGKWSTPVLFNFK